MKKIFALAASLMILATALTSCGSPKKTELIFPNGRDEETEYNKSVLSVEQFKATLTLPDGWSVSEERPEEIVFPATVFSKYYLYDGEKCVGGIGYNVIPEGISDDDFQYPWAVYNQICIANHYQFAVSLLYDEVKSTETSVCALTDVLYSAMMTGSEEKKNKGIVMYERLTGTYVAIELDAAVSDEDWRAIAESLTLEK